MRHFSSFALGCVVVFGLMSGCGPGAPKREYADVTGKVTYNGAPIKTGTVMFQPTAGANVVGDIQSDGTYSLKGVIGPNTVTITSREPETVGSGASPGQRKEAPKSFIPETYSMPQSGLKFEVKPGQNKADFELK